MKRLTSLALVGLGAVGAVALTRWWMTAQPRPVSPAAMAAQESIEQTAACRLQLGQQGAFRLSSQVEVGDQRDRFDGVMSWEVVSLDANVARVRAAFSEVLLTQDLSLPQERAASPAGLAFFLDIGRDCAVLSKTFAPEWDTNTRMLVSTQLDNYAFVLPSAGDTRWQAQATDGMGSYTAKFSREEPSSLAIEREKADHLAHDGAASFGIEVLLDDAKAVAHFDRASPLWWHSVSGQERVTVRAPGHPEVVMLQHFSLQRDDSMFASVPARQWQEADQTAPEGLATSDIHLKNMFPSYAEARKAFTSAIAAQPPRYFDGALALAAWLKANPADVATLVAELRGDMDDNARPTAFHALELSGTDEARAALSELINDYALSDVDQARAASALADVGVPSREVADLLLARADRDDTAAKVSLLAAGTLVPRSEDPALRDHLLRQLSDRHSAASASADRLLLLDSMGNSKDPHFAEILAEELSSQASDVRRHAAAALAKLPPEQAKPALLARLRDEQDPRVSTAVIKALQSTGAALPEVTAALDQRLTSANDSQRAAIVDLLGAQNSPAARQLLAKQFKRESNVRIQQQIGRYLPADALR